MKQSYSIEHRAAPCGGVCKRSLFALEKMALICTKSNKCAEIRQFCIYGVNLSPMSPTDQKYRGPRKPAWIGLVPYVPCVPYKKIASQECIQTISVQSVTKLRVCATVAHQSNGRCRRHCSGLGMLALPGFSGLAGDSHKGTPPIKVLPAIDPIRVIRTTSFR